MPPVADFPGFICELCSVRSVLNRELTHRGPDATLLALERMRMIDVTNSWSQGTHASYQSKLRVIRAFEGKFGVPVLQNTPVSRPPSSSAIPLMWAQQYYSIRPAGRRKAGSTNAQLAFVTVRGLRSAASMFHRLDLQTAYPGAAMLDRAQRAVAVRQCSPTDELSYAMMNSGMASRIGEDSNPSKELLATHVRFLDQHLEKLFNGPLSPAHKLEIARAGWTNLNLWCCWLRGGEHFGLRYKDVTCTRPANGPTRGLAPGVGCLEQRLNPATKASRTKTADAVIAYCTASGLSPGIWFDRLLFLEGLDDAAASLDERLICRHASGSPWTSRYFRSTYLWPSLQEQRLQGEPSLQSYDGSPGNSIPEQFWSSNSYRRGGRTHVSRKRPGCVRKASPAEVNEHGRWRVPRAQLDMPTAYNGWSLEDRVQMTLLCH